MTFQELSEVRKTLRVDWYRCPTRPGVLRELSRRSDSQGWFQAGGHLALFIVTSSLVFYCWSKEVWLAFLIALFFHGTVTSFFTGTAPHELGHGTVFKTKWLNKFFMYLFSSDRLVGSLTTTPAATPTTIAIRCIRKAIGKTCCRWPRPWPRPSCYSFLPSICSRNAAVPLAKAV